MCFQHSQLLIYVPLNFVFSDRNCVYRHARNHFILHYTGELLSEAENGIQQHALLIKYRAQTDHVPPVARGAVSTAFTGVTAGPVGPVVQLSRTTEQRKPCNIVNFYVNISDIYFYYKHYTNLLMRIITMQSTENESLH